MGDELTGEIEVKEGKNAVRLILHIGEAFERDYKGIGQEFCFLRISDSA